MIEGKIYYVIYASISHFPSLSRVSLSSLSLSSLNRLGFSNLILYIINVISYIYSLIFSTSSLKHLNDNETILINNETQVENNKQEIEILETIKDNLTNILLQNENISNFVIQQDGQIENNEL